jgi:RimJ/RimL family protein N-acetyltransferase
VATDPERVDPADVKFLTDWRNRYVNVFFHEFHATEKRTERWLTQTVGPDDGRILFMVEDLEGRVFAYIGLASIDWESRRCEVDALVRGGHAPRNTMATVHLGLIGWARGALGLDRVGGRARSDNQAVLAHLWKTDHVEERRVPLRSRSTDDGTLWTEDPTSTEARVEVVHVWHRRQPQESG